MYSRHITGGLEHSISLLDVQPRYKTQQENFDLVLQCWLNLLYLLLIGLAKLLHLLVVGVGVVDDPLVHRVREVGPGRRLRLDIFALFERKRK